MTVRRGSHARFLVASVVLFFGAGLLLYARALTIGFVADDWAFLALVRGSHSIGVCFEPLVGRFFRPLVVFIYYTGYKLFGLWTFPYHLAVLTVHALNAWLLCLLAVRIDGSHRRSMGIATGLLFLAFAGHSEAVTWVAGAADPLVTLFTFGMLLALDYALRSVRPSRWIALGWLMMVLGVLSKESSVIMPAIAGAYGASRLLQAASGDRRDMLRRLGTFLSGPVVLVVGVWLLRARVFGDPLAFYGGGLFERRGLFFSHTRALIIRSLLPPSARVEHAWMAGDDIPWLVIAGFVPVLLLWRRASRTAMLFAGVALALALAPAVPLLTISVGTTETERVVYLATGFSALITVLAVDAIPVARVLRVSAIVGLVLAHAVLLQRLNDRWRVAGDMFDGAMRSFVNIARAHDPGGAGVILLLNLPDNVRGHYVFRRAFHASLPFFAPDFEDRAALMIPVVSHSLQHVDDPIEVRREGPADFTLDVRPNMFFSIEPPARPFYTFPVWGRSQYRLSLTDVVGRAVVLYIADGRAHHLADVTGRGAPFGVVEIPAEGASCERPIRFSGWALDDREVARIIVTREEIGGARTQVGEGTWASGTRPDVAQAYRGFPHVDRAEWNYELPCASLSAVVGHGARFHVIAVDVEGQRSELGARTVQLPQ